MSDIWIPYGDGADLDPVTATAADVREGKTIVDKDGNPISGTMPDIAGRTITPTTSQQTLNGGGYLTGNVVVPGFTPPPPNVIKKGYELNVFGIKITGTCEGYFPTATDLYLRGNNIAGWSGNIWTFDSGQITIRNVATSMYLLSSKSYNLAGFTKCNVQCNVNWRVNNGEQGTFRFCIIVQQYSSSDIIELGNFYSGGSYLSSLQSAYYNGTYSIPFSKGVTTALRLYFVEQLYDANRGSWDNTNRGNFQANGAIYRIWLS